MLFCIIGARFPALVSQPKEANTTPASGVVIIDAGHGGEDGGAVSKSGICEKDINLRLSMLLGDIFDAAGYSAVQTRTEDRLLYDRNVDFHGRKKILDMAARLNIAKSRNAELFISIHMNAFPQPIYRGLQVYYSPHHKDSENIAKSIQALAKTSLQPTNNRDVNLPAERYIFLISLIIPRFSSSAAFSQIRTRRHSCAMKDICKSLLS